MIKIIKSDLFQSSQILKKKYPNILYFLFAFHQHIHHFLFCSSICHHSEVQQLQMVLHWVNIFANQSNFGNFLGESQLNGNKQTNFKAASVFNNDNNNINTGSPEKNANTKKTQKQTNKTYQMGNQHLQHLSKFQIYRCSKRVILLQLELYSNSLSD